MRSYYFEILLADEPFYLLVQKAIYRPAKKQLILSDIHLGKATHFRKEGLLLPAQSHLKDIDALHFLLNTWQPQTVLILGDLFHSDYNREWLWFKSLVMHYPKTEFVLIEGNHDILKEEHYDLPNLIKRELLEEKHFIFTHHPLDEPVKINFCGHIHPGFRITGIAKQSEKMPCFYLYKNHFILPAFGHLTGMHVLQWHQEAYYYLVAGSRVIEYK